MTIRVSFFMALSSLVLLSGCNDFKAWYAKEFRQGDLTEGVVRLSTQSLSMVASEVSKRFNDKDVEVMIEKDPNAVGKGTVTKTLKNVVIDHPAGTVVYEDCHKNQATWKGQVVVDATQIITGTLTNNPERPVIPSDDPKSIHMKVSFKPKEFAIAFTNQPENFLDLDEGEISFDAYPRLATSQDKASVTYGMRVVPTSNMFYENVSFANVKGKLNSTEVNTDFDISEGNVTIQVGQGEEHENYLKGEVVAFGNRRTIPLKENALDPNYNREEFIATYSCKDGLAGNVQYVHTPFEHKIAPGVAGLAMTALGTVIGKYSKDHTCGMASPAFLRTTQITKTDGFKGFSTSTHPDAPCVLTFELETDADCFGKAHKVSGTAKVTRAKKTLNGDLLLENMEDFLAGVGEYETELTAAAPEKIAEIVAMKPEAVLPRSMQPAELSLTVEFENFSIVDICKDKEGSPNHEQHCGKTTLEPIKFSIRQGTISAVVKPVMAKSTDKANPANGLCAVPTPNAQAKVSLERFEVSIQRGPFEFGMSAEGKYELVNGIVGDRENYLDGGLKVGLVDSKFPPSSKLNPMYDRQMFIDSFKHCQEGKFKLVTDNEQCK